MSNYNKRKNKFRLSLKNKRPKTKLSTPNIMNKRMKLITIKMKLKEFNKN